MLARISRTDGSLVIEPQNDTEAFAIRTWVFESMQSSSSSISEDHSTGHFKGSRISVPTTAQFKESASALDLCATNPSLISAHITVKGVMTITPHSPTAAYALSRWMDTAYFVGSDELSYIHKDKFKCSELAQAE